MILNYLLITCIVAYCWDVSGGWREITKTLCGWLTKGKIHNPIDIKPFSCGTCMTFWLCLLFTLVTWRVTLVNIALCCLASWSEELIAGVLIRIKEWIIAKMS